MNIKNNINYFNVNDPRIVSLKYLFFRRCIPIRLAEYVKQKVFGSGIYYSEEFIKTKSVFIHIPKAAGTSIAKAFYGGRQGHHTALAYKQADPKKFNSYYKYTVVRNPYSRLYSTYNYLLNSPHAEDQKWARENISEFESFDEFVKRWINLPNIKSWKHFLPQSYFVCDSHGGLLVDDFGHLESLNEIFEQISSRLGVIVDLPEENVVSTSADNYKKHYTEESLKIVHDVYSKDFELFGYSYNLN